MGFRRRGRRRERKEGIKAGKEGFEGEVRGGIVRDVGLMWEKCCWSFFLSAAGKGGKHRQPSTTIEATGTAAVRRFNQERQRQKKQEQEQEEAEGPTTTASATKSRQPAASEGCGCSRACLLACQALLSLPSCASAYSVSASALASENLVSAAIHFSAASAPSALTSLLSSWLAGRQAGGPAWVAGRNGNDAAANEKRACLPAWLP